MRIIDKYLTEDNMDYISSIVGLIAGVVGFLGSFGIMEEQAVIATISIATAINGFITKRKAVIKK